MNTTACLWANMCMHFLLRVQLGVELLVLTNFDEA